jgi:DNA primase
VISFIGRAAADAQRDTAPKYLNSPAGLFYKSRLLFALGEDRADLAAGTC